MTADTSVDASLLAARAAKSRLGARVVEVELAANEDLAVALTLSRKGKKIAASFGTINHLYILALLEKGGLTPDDVTLVNTPPPDMTFRRTPGRRV